MCEKVGSQVPRRAGQHNQQGSLTSGDGESLTKSLASHMNQRISLSIRSGIAEAIPCKDQRHGSAADQLKLPLGFLNRGLNVG